MATYIITATEASRSLSNILNKVHFQGESYEIKRGKQIIAKIIPVVTAQKILKVTELNNLFKRLPHLIEGDEDRFEKDIVEIRANTKLEDDKWD